MDATRAWTLIRRWWWLLLVGAVMAIAAYGVSARIRDRQPSPPTYVARAMLFVDLHANGADGPEVGPPLPAKPYELDSMVASYATLITGRVVGEQVVLALGLHETADEARARISATRVKETQLIEVTARATTAAEADGFVAAAVDAMHEIRTERALPGDAILYETTPAALAGDSQSEVLTVLLVALAGLVATGGIILAFEYLSDAVRDAAEAEAAAGLQSLASIPVWNTAQSSIADAPGAADRYRLLRTNIAQRTRQEPAQTIVFVAPRAACGTTTTAVNYAAMLAQAGRRVVLVDGDLRGGRLGARFGSDVPHGLADALALDLPVYGLVDATPIDGLSLVTAGAAFERPSELLESPRFEGLLRELRERFDAIVIDAPPLLECADATTLAAHCDAAVVVLRCERTTRKDAAEAGEAARRVAPRVLGVVLNADVSVNRALPSPGILRRLRGIAEARV